jgi:anti-sigma-K factor RskA
MTRSSEHAPRSDDAAAYLLGALDAEEAAEFRAHSDSCAVCTAELERLGAPAAMLALAAPQLDAPARLRRRVVSAARAERRAPAREPRRQPRAWARRLELVGAGGLAVGLAIGAFVIGAASPGTTVIRARVASVSFWRGAMRPVAWLERSGSHAELVVDHLPQAPYGKVYEIWIERGGKPRPTDALFQPTSSGHADANVPGGVAGAAAVLVTAEPRGGTKAPTMAPLIDAVLRD